MWCWRCATRRAPCGHGGIGGAKPVFGSRGGPRVGAVRAQFRGNRADHAAAADSCPGVQCRPAGGVGHRVHRRRCRDDVRGKPLGSLCFSDRDSRLVGPSGAHRCRQQRHARPEQAHRNADPRYTCAADLAHPPTDQNTPAEGAVDTPRPSCATCSSPTSSTAASITENRA